MICSFGNAGFSWPSQVRSAEWGLAGGGGGYAGPACDGVYGYLLLVCPRRTPLELLCTSWVATRPIAPHRTLLQFLSDCQRTLRGVEAWEIAQPQHQPLVCRVLVSFMWSHCRMPCFYGCASAGLVRLGT